MLLSVAEAKRAAILFLFGCSEANSTLLITSELGNQSARKALFTWMLYTTFRSVFINENGLEISLTLVTRPKYKLYVF